MLNDILDLSKIEAGRMDLELRPFDLGDTVRDVVSLLAVRAEARGPRPAADAWRPTCPHGWWASASRLRQVLLNLVGNALKFTEHGSVTVTLAAPSPGPTTGWR